MIKTTDELLDSIKLRTMAPTSQNTFTDARLLVLMSQELRSYVVPKIISVREDFFLAYKDVPVTADREQYPIVERAVGNSLKAVTFVDSNGKERPIYRTDVKSIKRFDTTGTPHQFMLMGDNIRVLPAANVDGGFIRQYYFRSSSDLVKTSSTSKIISIAKGATTTVYTVNTDISGNVAVDGLIDFQSAKSPFQLWEHDVVVQAITLSTITVNNSEVADASDVSRVAVGDYICLAQETNIPQIPVDYHTLLIQRVCVKIYEAINDARKLTLAKADLKEMEHDLFKLIKSRVESQPRKIKNNRMIDAIGY